MAILVIVFALSMLIGGAWYVYADWQTITTASPSMPLTAAMWNAIKHDLDHLSSPSIYSVSTNYTTDNSACSPRSLNMGPHSACLLTSYNSTTIDGVVDGEPVQSGCTVTLSGSDWILTAIWRHNQYGLTATHNCPRSNSGTYTFGTWCSAICFH